MHAIVDAIFGPVQTVLQDAINSLSGLALTMRRGIDIGAYLGPVAALTPGWAAAVKSLLTGAALVGIAAVGRAVYDIYLSLKQGVQWW